MSEGDNEFVALLDKHASRAEEIVKEHEKKEKQIEKELAEIEKKDQESLAEKIAVALVYLEKNPEKKSEQVEYLYCKYDPVFIKKAITTLVARGHYVTQWVHPQYPRYQHETIKFYLEIYRIGAYPAGTCQYPMMSLALCNLL